MELVECQISFTHPSKSVLVRDCDVDRDSFNSPLGGNRSSVTGAWKDLIQEDTNLIHYCMSILPGMVKEHVQDNHSPILLVSRVAVGPIPVSA